MSKILVIEDEPDTVKVIEKRLSDHGFKVIVSYDGYRGIELARKEKPDLIILDLMLPAIDGHKVCGLLKKDKRFTDTPIIIFTAKAQEEDMRLAREVGADAYISKPFQLSELLAKVEELLREKNKPKQEKEKEDEEDTDHRR